MPSNCTLFDHRLVERIDIGGLDIFGAILLEDSQSIAYTAIASMKKGDRLKRGDANLITASRIGSSGDITILALKDHGSRTCRTLLRHSISHKVFKWVYKFRVNKAEDLEIIDSIEWFLVLTVISQVTTIINNMCKVKMQ